MTDIYLQGNALLCRCISVVKSTETDPSFRAGKPLTAGYYLSLERPGQRKSSGIGLPANYPCHFPEVSVKSHPVTDSKLKSSTQHFTIECSVLMMTDLGLMKRQGERGNKQTKEYTSHLLLFCCFFCSPLLWRNVYYLVKKTNILRECRGGIKSVQLNCLSPRGQIKKRGEKP